MSRYGRNAPNDCKVYVGDLPKDASEKELERAFNYFGRLRNVWVARNPPGFAFVEFEDYRDAEDSVKELDGTNICGVRARVELSSGKVRPKPWLRGGRGPSRSDGRRAFNPDDRCYECGERGHYAYDCSRSRKGYGESSSSRRKRIKSKISISSVLEQQSSLRINQTSLHQPNEPPTPTMLRSPNLILPGNMLGLNEKVNTTCLPCSICHTAALTLIRSGA